jgi:hypothetical protein
MKRASSVPEEKGLRMNPIQQIAIWIKKVA